MAGVTRYFSLDKARSHFNYEPQPRDLSATVQWFKERGKGRIGQSPPPTITKRIWSFLVKLLVFLGLLALILSCLPKVI